MENFYDKISDCDKQIDVIKSQIIECNKDINKYQGNIKSVAKSFIITFCAVGAVAELVILGLNGQVELSAIPDILMNYVPFSIVFGSIPAAIYASKVNNDNKKIQKRVDGLVNSKNDLEKKIDTIDKLRNSYLSEQKARETSKQAAQRAQEQTQSDMSQEQVVEETKSRGR